MFKEKDEYISLKDAAKISGYSADYVGQLIRSGKLRGKQVYLNVAWMTTEKAILEYLRKENKKDAIEKNFIGDRVSTYLVSPQGLKTMNLMVMGVVVGVLTLFVLFLVYIFAVTIDRHIDQTSLHKVQYAQ